MKKVFLMFIMTLFVATLSACDDSDDRPTPSGKVPDQPDTSTCKAVDFEYDYDALTYNLVWGDEFDGTELDEDKWVYEVNGSGGGNNELQYYTRDNTVVEDGILKIIARNEEYLGRDYTSSRITSKGYGEFKYGIIEIRSKQPVGTGTWSANWMMPAVSKYGGWPNSGEIDIMEFVGYDPGLVHATVHTDLYNHPDNTQKGSSLSKDNDYVNEFHTFKLEWLPDKMTFYVDDVSYFTYKPSRYSNCPDQKSWPFDNEFFIILNVAIGGGWGGANGVDDSIFPTTMEVDFVRVYQAKEFEQYQ